MSHISTPHKKLTPLQARKAAAITARGAAAAATHVPRQLPLRHRGDPASGRLAGIMQKS